ncbi:MAG: hypothetical protein HY764_01425 [Candidatus Portnoybacteria bacterium]|nr:hypothetical protein [Candidatus Portnoybacteria bacterium]
MSKFPMSELWIRVCPLHGVRDFARGQGFVIDGRLYCSIPEEGRVCYEDIKQVAIIKNTPDGHIAFKTEEEIESEIQKILEVLETRL